jgi:four helix bundle protein
MKIYFDHERLHAYQKALAFAAWCEPILERVPKSASVHGQLDRARTSAPLNIAEGNGKFTPADKCKFFDIAHGSALESAACLDLLLIKQALTEAELEEGKTILSELVGCLIGLIKSKAPARFAMHEETVEYRVSGESGSGSGSMSESGSMSGREKL